MMSDAAFVVRDRFFFDDLCTSDCRCDGESRGISSYDFEFACFGYLFLPGVFEQIIIGIHNHKSSRWVLNAVLTIISRDQNVLPGSSSSSTPCEVRG